MNPYNAQYDTQHLKKVEEFVRSTNKVLFFNDIKVICLFYNDYRVILKRLRQRSVDDRDYSERILKF